MIIILLIIGIDSQDLGWTVGLGFLFFFSHFFLFTLLAPVLCIYGVL